MVSDTTKLSSIDLKGELLLKKDKRADAERCFKRSLEIAKSQKAKSLLIRTEMSRLRVSSGTLQ